MRWPILGAIRFYLAMVVAGSHLTSYVMDPVGLAFTDLSSLTAVIGFLIISGYSIAASYAREQTGFYRRRLLRILPLYGAAIAVCVLAPFIARGLPIDRYGGNFDFPGAGQVIGNCFFLQGFLVKPLQTNPVVWSLSVEVFFYVITPWIARLSQTMLLVAVGASAALFASARWFNLPPYTELLIGLNVALFGWAWLVGFWLRREKENSVALIVAFSLGMLAMALNKSYTGPQWPITWTIAVIGIGYAHRVPFHHRIASILSVLGDASYPLYLFHLPLFGLIYVFRPSTNSWVYLLVAIGVAIILDQAFDKQVKRLVAGAADLWKHSHWDGKVIEQKT